MDHDFGRALDAVLAVVCLALAAAIIVSATRKAEPLVITAIGLLRDATA
jgi:anti-sigma-K factor RskA